MAQPKVALVTGAVQGIGRSIADRLLEEGYRVVYSDVNASGLETITEQMSSDAAKARAMVVRLDVADEYSIQSAVNQVVDAWGSIDILVNNAGIRYVTPVNEITREEWDRVLAVNLTGTFFMTQAVLPVMRRAGWGRVVNISSFGGQAGPLTSGAHYCASKAGQLALTKVFARALAAEGITVNAVAPAAIETPEMLKMTPGSLAQMAKGIPVGRFGKAEEVAAVVSFLVSETAGYITGATFDINGGMLMR